MPYPEPPRDVRPGDMLVVIRECFIAMLCSHPRLITFFVDDFVARGEDELTLKRGDRVELLQLDDGYGDGWYTGRHVVSNLCGLFPGGKKPYLRKLCTKTYHF